MRLCLCLHRLPMREGEGGEVIGLFALHLTKAENSRLCLKAELTAGPQGKNLFLKKPLGVVWMPLGACGTGTSVCVPCTVWACSGM